MAQRHAFNAYDAHTTDAGVMIYWDHLALRQTPEERILGPYPLPPMGGKAIKVDAGG